MNFFRLILQSNDLKGKCTIMMIYAQNVPIRVTFQIRPPASLSSSALLRYGLSNLVKKTGLSLGIDTDRAGHKFKPNYDWSRDSSGIHFLPLIAALCDVSTMLKHHKTFIKALSKSTSS